ncbi:hypothetical protein DRQ09_10170 [candidate division KSB1 bacterium]|nr:MAG: hypothetical protein DRQ09_10170 [candidate division KSB1 bacterium]
MSVIKKLIIELLENIKIKRCMCMRLRLFLSVVLLLILPVKLLSYQNSKSLENSGVVNIMKIEEKINIDGKLNEPVWKKAPKIELNYEISPGDNVPPEVKTEAFFLYDDNSLYIGFICYEKDMKKLRAHISERDKLPNDDLTGLFLDTFNDQKKAYVFAVNPYGIQIDETWTSDNEDITYDMLWNSAGKILKDRWTVEIEIPFKSISFPEKETQVWRMHVMRIRPRSSREQISWMKIDRDNPNSLGQAGLLKGIRNIKRGKYIYILPYSAGARKSQKEDYDSPSSNFVNNRVKGDAGVGFKYGLSSNLNLDVVLNPDFSQVESDATQIDVNTTFALYYPEKRPFFQEGNEIFQTHLGRSLFYSRTINNPLLAVKLTGKVGKVKMGYISAYDENSPYIIPFEEKSRSIPSNRKSFSNILRLKYDLGGESYIGSIITDREERNAVNRVGGIDARFNIKKNYYWEFQLVGSNTKEPDNPKLYEDDDLFSRDKKTATFDGEQFSGIVFYTKFRRRARHFNYFLQYEDYSPSFRAYNGFVNSNNFRYYEINADINFYPDNKILDFFNFSPRFSQTYNHQNQLKNSKYDAGVFLRMKKQMSLYLGYTYRHRRFRNIMFKDLYNLVLFLNGEPNKYFNFSIVNNFGRDIYQTTDNPRRAFSKYFQFSFTLRPLSNVSIDNNYTHYSLDELNSEGNIFNGYTLRNTVNYQITRNLYFRLVTQYNSFSRKYQFDPLIRYKLNPFTIFYIGSTNDLKKFEEPYGFRYLERQYFIKLQYLFQI